MENYRALAGHLDPLLLSEGCYLTLGGIAQAQQEEVAVELIDMLKERRESRAVEEDPHPRADELSLSDWQEEAAAWKSLAQGNESGIFGPGDGALYWITPRTDLSQSRFDRTELVYQC